jgi:P27 family predicted phage terminase small subunit
LTVGTEHRQIVDGQPRGDDMRGRKPKPGAGREDAPNIPELAAGDPEELKGDPVGLAEWNRLHAVLTDTGIMTEGDRTAVLAVCQQWSLYQQALGKISESGLVVTAPTSGYQMPNPYISIAGKALLHCEKLWVELGLTPSARTRVSGRKHPDKAPRPQVRQVTGDPRKLLRMPVA